MAGKEQEPYPWKLTPGQVFVEPDSKIFTSDGQLRFGIYIKAQAIEAIVATPPLEDPELRNRRLAQQKRLIQEISEEFHQLHSPKEPEPSLADFIKEFADIVQARAPYIQLNGQLSGKWDILPRKKKSKLTNLSEWLQW